MNLFEARYTVEPPNKGHIGDNVNSAVLYLICTEVLNVLGKVIIGTSTNVLYRKVYCKVSLLQRVHCSILV